MDNKKKDKKSDAEAAAELIKEYMLQDEQVNINSSDKFSLHFALSKDGIVDTQIDWPEGDIDDDFIALIASMMYSINVGAFKSLMLEAVAESFTQRSDLEKESKKLIEKWLDYKNAERTEPCVRPRDVIPKG